jgi:hypothetical protein
MTHLTTGHNDGTDESKLVIAEEFMLLEAEGGEDLAVVLENLSCVMGGLAFGVRGNNSVRRE